MSRRVRRSGAAGLLAFVTLVSVRGSPAPAPVQQAPAAAPAAAPAQLLTLPADAVVAEPSGETATLTYFNRPIVVLRARVLGRRPSERAALATRVLGELVTAGLTRPVAGRAIEAGVLIGVERHVIIGVTPLDVDVLAGETLQSVADETVARLQSALDEAVESRRPAVWLRAAALAAAGLALGLTVLWVLGRLRRRVEIKLSDVTAKAVARTGLSDQQALRASHLLNYFERRFLTFVIIGLRLLVAYWTVAFALRQFPYSRPWGESLRGFLLGTIGGLGLGLVRGVPALFTIFVILILTRFVIKLLEPWFDAVERGAVKVPWIHQETAATTRRLMTTMLWLFAAAVAYPYVPGSNTDAFKGLSVVVALMVSLGSSGIVNQMMSGFMVTYSRALRVGDYVKIGDVEGTITHLGLLSTKLTTLRSEEITIPNAIVVSNTTTDYSRLADVVRTPTSVTIGYDTPWRQVHAMLLLAAERTPGIRRDPAPRVLQTALEDAAVKYTLTVCLEDQQSRYLTLSALHANIQDIFNEHGVQIMTPNYEADPQLPKVVAKQDWFAAPARQDPPPRD
jgi:small-conductance mechanosensitive channel